MHRSQQCHVHDLDHSVIYTCHQSLSLCLGSTFDLLFLESLNITHWAFCKIMRLDHTKNKYSGLDRSMAETSPYLKQ